MGTIYQGAAHSSYGNTTPGDQRQSSVPDSQGEVSAYPWTGSSKRTYTIWRPTNASMSTPLATAMLTACNNANLGYDQGSRYGVMPDKVDITTPANCDCSSLVTACINRAYGTSFGAQTTASLPGAIFETFTVDGKPAFENCGPYRNQAETPVYNGDILNNASAHVLIIVSGNPRPGQKDTDLATSTVSGGGGNFGARKQKPTQSDLYFVSKAAGGYSPFPTKQSGTVLPSAAAYAWGRFSEVMNEDCKLSRNELVGDWYKHDEDEYDRSVAPTLGALMCFTLPSGKGFLAVVEDIDYEEGDIKISYSTDKTFFKYKKLKKSHRTWNFDSYIFQGFIHNPAIEQEYTVENPLETFIKVAEEAVGVSSADIKQVAGLKANDPWSAGFLLYCSITAKNTLNVIIPNTSSCSSIAQLGVERHMGSWIEGPGQGNMRATPEVGDIMLLRHYPNKDYPTTYSADGCAIVTEVGKSSVTVMAGDIQQSVKKLSYTFTSPYISGYYRPDWDMVDGMTDYTREYRTFNGLYTTAASKEDAAAVEVGYYDRYLQPSIHKSDIQLSAINYTGMLANFYDVFGRGVLASDQTDADLVVALETETEEYTGGGAMVDGVSENLFNLVTHYEGCRLTAYYDSGGVLTIGWGTTAAAAPELGLHPGMTITQEVADMYFRKEILVCLGHVTQDFGYMNLSQNEADALASLCYNCGPSGYKGVIDSGASRQAIANKWRSYKCRDAKGNYLKGLEYRRHTESDLFLYGTLTFYN